MMKILSFLSTIASVLYLTVGIHTYRLNKKAREGFVFLMLNITLAIWALAFSYTYVAEDTVTFSFWNKISAIGWCFFPALVLYLVFIITKHNWIHRLFVKLVILFPAFILFFTAVFMFHPDVEKIPLLADFFYIGDFIYNTVYIILSIVVLFQWGIKSDNKNHKKQSRILVITGIIPFALSLITQNILPALGVIRLPNMSQLFILIMLWGINYAIVNYNFMLISNSLITDELFNEIMDLTFVIDLDGIIIRTNKQVLNLLQYEIADLVSVPITDMIPDQELKNRLEQYESITDPVKINNICIKTKKGAAIPLNITIAPIKNSKNQILLGFLIVGQDTRLIENLKSEITNHKKTTEKLVLSEELFRTVVETIPFAITLAKKDDDRILYVNHNAEALFKVNYKEFMGMEPYLFYLQPEDRKKLVEDLGNQKPIKEREIVFKRIDNTIFNGTITMVPAVYNEQEVLLSCIYDITEQKKLQQNIVKSEEMLRKLMNSIPDLVTVSDMNGKIIFMNKSIHTILGYDQEEDLPDTITDYLAPEYVRKAEEHLEKIVEKEIGYVEYKYRKKDGTYIDAEVNGNILKDELGEPFGYIFVTRDITDRKKVQESLEKSKEEIEKINNELLKSNFLLHEKSIRDSLTNLYNHQYILELLEEDIKHELKTGSGLSLMMLDIDFFKIVNDNFGHQIGDKVLNTISRLIQLNIRETDHAGRYGGEEFIIILPDITQEEALQIAENIRISIQNFSFLIEGLKVTISIGLTRFQKEDSKTFINRADTLLYAAKKNGRNRTETDAPVHK